MTAIARSRKEINPQGLDNWPSRAKIPGNSRSIPPATPMRATFPDYDLKAVLPAERHEKTALQTPTRANRRPRRGRRVCGMPRVPRSLRVQRTEGHEYRRERRG